MNVKIAETAVTFKISEEELNVLLGGQILEKIVPIAANDFAMVIDPAGKNDDIPLKLILDRDESCLMLCTSPEQIQKLAAMGKSREGLSCHWNGIDIELQVDVRADSRPRKKA